MFKTNGPKAIEHADAGCVFTATDQLCKTYMNGLPSAVFSSQNTPFLNKPDEVKRADKYRDNVISITTAIRSAEAVKVSAIKFIYPMLECS